MSQKREKRLRQEEREIYKQDLRYWYEQQPPKWRFISHWLWRKAKPKKPWGCHD